MGFPSRTWFRRRSTEEDLPRSARATGSISTWRGASSRWSLTPRAVTKWFHRKSWRIAPIGRNASMSSSGAARKCFHPSAFFSIRCLPPKPVSPRRIKGTDGEGSHRDDQGQRASRPRRGWFSDGPEVELRSEGYRQTDLSVLQRRRKRAGNLQRSSDYRTGSPSTGRGHHHCRIRRRLPSRLHLHPRRVFLWLSCSRESSRGSAGTWIPGEENLRKQLRLRHRSALRRRRLHLR